MENITKLIKKDRPNIRDITLKNYTRYLQTILNGVESKDINIVKKFDKIKPFLESKKMSVRKALTASILVYLRAENEEKNKDIIDKYRIYLLDLNKKYTKDKSDREKDERENNNWATLEELHKIRQKLHKKVVEENIPVQETLSNKEKDLLQQYLVASLYTLLPPRRNIYSSVNVITLQEYNKLKGDELKKNYLVFNKPKTKIFFHFGKQKSKNFTKPQKIEVTKELKKVIKLYLKHHEGNALLKNKKGERMTENGLTKYLNKVFKIGNKKISSSMIRKIFASEVVGKAHELIEETAEKMGHSVATQKSNYVKK